MSYTFCPRVIKFLLLTVVLIQLALPSVTFAASARPTCILKVLTPDGVVTIREKERRDVFIQEGNPVQITWKSKNAQTASDRMGGSVPLSGIETFVLKESADYSYHFSSGNKEVLCEVSVHVVRGNITSSPIFREAKPIISGTASGVTTVQVLVRREGAIKVLYKSKMLRVRNEKWKARVSKKLPDGTYEVEVIVGKGTTMTTLATGTFTINTDKKNNSSVSATTFVVKAVPLLTGGMASAGSVVTISYLQIVNSGKETALLQGFWVKQNGSAPGQAVIGLSVVDDQGVSRGFTGGVEGSTPFKNGSAFVSAAVAFAPGQMRLFTIKSILAGNTSSYSYRGKQIMIDVTSVDATAPVRGIFPIRGTTWIIQ